MGAGIKVPIAADARHGPETLSESIGKCRVRTAISACTPADHIGLRHFLTEIFGSGYPAEFQASLEDPCYAPGNRLLLRRMGRLIAHVRVTGRVMQFGALSFPVAAVQGLATAAHCRQQGLGTHLLLAAEKQMAQSGALLGLLWTRIPYFFRRTGWALCHGNTGYTATPHAVLGRLLEEGLCLRRAPRIQVRPWRRWEEDAITRVYRQNLPGSYGLLERSRAYWHWLLERRAYDQFYVALDGPDLWDFKESSTRLVGYAAVKGEKIIELVTVPDRRKAAMELLARTCGDAIEQDHRQVALYVPADSPLREYFPGAPESLPRGPGEHAECCMARLLDPLGLLRKMCGAFVERAKAAGLGRPLELGLLVDGRKYQIEIAGRARATADTLGRSYLRLNVADFTRLLLGQLDWDRALAEDRVAPSTALAGDVGRVLFPPLPFWRPLLDELRA
jgi:predicted N-acetyltransferase YhbS